MKKILPWLSDAWKGFRDKSLLHLIILCSGAVVCFLLRIHLYSPPYQEDPFMDDWFNSYPTRCLLITAIAIIIVIAFHYWTMRKRDWEDISPLIVAELFLAVWLSLNVHSWYFLFIWGLIVWIFIKSDIHKAKKRHDKEFNEIFSRKYYEPVYYEI